jgi:hypothetical protein
MVLPVVALGFNFELFITVEYNHIAGEKNTNVLRHDGTGFRKSVF